MMIFTNILAILFYFLIQINCQESETDHILIEFDKLYNGTLDYDNSYYFYKFIIPNDIKVNTTDLVFRVKEYDSADVGKSDFSDPDIYISKTNYYPKSYLDSEYFSERYGEDFLSIPSEDIVGGKVFYFSIYCQFKCNYQFVAKFETEFKIKENEIYSFSLKEGTSRILKFDQLKSDAKEIEFISYSHKISPFKMFVSTKRNPSSQNTLPIIPSWIGGYYASITKNSFNFCFDCTYYILLEAEKGTADIFFMIKYENSVNKVNIQEPIFSTLKPVSMHCYSVEITDQFKNETLIVQTMLFSGSASLLINPWKNPREGNNTGTRNGLFYDFKFKNDIFSESLKLITPEERKEENTVTGNVYICIRSFEYTSYLIKIFFANQIEKFQKFNFLFTGVTLNGYLPANSISKYRAVEFTKDSDIFFDLQIKSGNLNLFGYVCEEAKKCIFNHENFESKKSQMILSVKTPNGYRVTIPDKLNTCHRKLEKEDSQENEAASLPCAIFGIVKCEGNIDCSYNIIATHSNSITKLRERKPHYQIVPFNETDSYKLTIDDESISNVTIILNSNTGDADLFVSGLDNQFDSRSLNEGYIPDVIRIEKNQNFPNIIGDYSVNVKGSTFASYSIYYYTHKINENNNTKNKTSDDMNINYNDYRNHSLVINLETGKIIKGYITEEKGKINYRLYSFNPNLLRDSEALDIRITLTPEHSEYEMYVIFDINNIKFETSVGNLYLKNYLWRSNLNNEIIIKKSDPNYKKENEYFILIVPRYTNYFYPLGNRNISEFQENNSTDSNLQFHSFFFLGVTLEDIPFVIQEGIPSSITLDSEYDSQNYWYYHYNISNPVLISLNVFYGRVDIYIDLFWSNDISTSSTAIKALDTDSNFISISPEKIQALINGNSPSNSNENSTMSIIPLYILVKKSSFVDAQYLLAIKSESSKPEKLQPSLVRSEFLLSGEYRNYFIHLRRNDTGLFNIIFTAGYGDLYVNIFNSNDYENTNNYPNSKKFMFKASDYYRGKTLSISENLLQICALSCKILLSVHGNNLGFSDDKIEYSLSFYKDALKINQNQPYHNTINEGELQFFRVFFGENSKNVYISLTNMNGDADVYVNFGTHLPSFENSNWFSYSNRNEFIEFDKNDNFFIENKLESITGEYTIMISGFKKTTYSLYITSHPKKILPLNDNSPASCITKQDAEYCYFRYDDVYDYDMIINDSYNNINTEPFVAKKDLDLVVLTHFIYGSGEIFAKLYDDTDYDILADFPDEANYDFTNMNSNKRNFLHLSVDKNNPKYNTNSTILLSVKCLNKCFFDVTATRQYNSTIKYLDNSRENTYFLYKSTTPLLFIYYNNKQGDINYNIKAINGDGNIIIYKNETIIETSHDISRNSQEVKVTNFNEYEACSHSKNISDIHGLIKYSNLKLYENIYFKIIPTTDFAFSIKLTYKNDWQEIKTGKTETFVVDHIKKKFYGFFTMHNEFDNVILNISPNNRNLTAYCYVKYMAYDKSEILNSTNKNYLQTKIQTHVIPSELDSDYKGNNLNLYNLIAMKLPKLDLQKLQNKIVTVLFSVALFDHSSDKNIQDIKLNIRASSQVNNITISSIPENSLEFVALEGFDSDSNIHIYDLKRSSESDDILVLEVSSCLGAVEILISKVIINSRENAFKKAVIPFSVENNNGRNIYTFKEINVDNVYLLINAKQVISQDCKLEFQEYQLKCNKKHSEVLIKYFFTKTSSIYNQPKLIDDSITLEYKILNSKSVDVKWKPIRLIDINDKVFDANVKYEVYVTDSVNDFLYMDSICYLNMMSTLKNKPELNVEINNNKNEAKINKFLPGKQYFINILATNLETKDVYAYKSIEIITQEDRFPPILIGKFLCLKFLN